MRRHPHGLAAPVRLWAVLAAAIMAIAACTSSPAPLAGPSITAATSASHGVTTSSNAAASSQAGGASTATRPDTSTRTSATAVSPATRTGPAAARTSSPPAGRSSASAAAAPATSKRAPKPTTTPAPTTRTSAKPVATSPHRPPPTTPVAPSGAGNIHETVPAVTPVTMQAAALTAAAQPDAGVTVQVTDIRAVSTEARFPGEIAGPGLAVTVHIINSSRAAIDLDNAIVDVLGADGSRAVQVSGSPAAPMSGSLAPGQQASGVYVFTIPQDQRDPISIRFSYAAQTPTVLFVGDAQ